MSYYMLVNSCLALHHSSEPCAYNLKKQQNIQVNYMFHGVVAKCMDS